MTITPLRLPASYAAAPPKKPATLHPATPNKTPKTAAAPPRDETRILGSNPLFVDGANYDEFQLNGSNVEFAKTRFGLDQAFVDLVKSDLKNVRLSVVYHSDDKGLQVDAYRAAAAAGKGAVFAAYNAKSADFDPGQVYRSELSTPLGGGKFFGTVLASKRLAVPDSAGAATRQFLTENGFKQKETVPFSSLGYPNQFKDFFGLRDQMGVQMFDLHKQSFAERFGIFYQLTKESPEYRMFKVGDVLSTTGAAMLLGVLTPKLWEQGTAYGIASTVTSIANIGEPAVGIVGEGLLGSVVDNAVNSDRPLDNLKKVNLATGALDTGKAAGYLALHPAVISHFAGPHPGPLFVGIYATSSVLGTISGVINGKADMAIHDQLINKSVLRDSDLSKNYYQILGVESSISQALYLGAYSATVAAVASSPHLSLPLAAAGAGLWGVSNFLWPLYHEKPELKTTIAGSAYIHQGDRYVFDSGWEVSFKGGKGRIVQDDPNHFSIAVDDGDLYLKNDAAHSVDMRHKRDLKDYLPKFLKPKIFGEKERWELANGGGKVAVSRYGNQGYHLNKVSDNEFLVTRSTNPPVFW